MLRVIVELVPGGYSPLRRTIASMNICNMSDLADVSNYKIDVMEGANPLAGTNARSTSVQVSDHDRRQSVWKLVGAAIAAMEGAEFDEL